MAERTPPMSAIRSAWAKAHPFPLTTDVDERYAEFDRAMAAHDAEVRAQADSEIQTFREQYIPRLTDAEAALAEARAGVVTEEPESEYVPGWIADDGRARISQGVIAPGYVAEFIAEGGEVVRRRVSRFETVTADMVPVEQGDET